MNLEAKVGEIDCAAVQSKTMNEELETHLAAAGSRMLGS